MNCLQTAPLQQISAHRSLQHEYAEVLIQNTTQSRACCAACGNVQRAHNKPQSISGHQKVERQVQMPMRCPCRQFHSDVLIPCCAHPCDDTSVNKLRDDMLLSDCPREFDANESPKTEAVIADAISHNAPQHAAHLRKGVGKSTRASYNRTVGRSLPAGLCDRDVLDGGALLDDLLAAVEAL